MIHLWFIQSRTERSMEFIVGVSSLSHHCATTIYVFLHLAKSHKYDPVISICRMGLVNVTNRFCPMTRFYVRMNLLFDVKTNHFWLMVIIGYRTVEKWVKASQYLAAILTRHLVGENECCNTIFDWNTPNSCVYYLVSIGNDGHYYGLRCKQSLRIPFFRFIYAFTTYNSMLLPPVLVFTTIYVLLYHIMLSMSYVLWIWEGNPTDNFTRIVNDKVTDNELVVGKSLLFSDCVVSAQWFSTIPEQTGGIYVCPLQHQYKQPNAHTSIALRISHTGCIRCRKFNIREHSQSHRPSLPAVTLPRRCPFCDARLRSYPHPLLKYAYIHHVGAVGAVGASSGERRLVPCCCCVEHGNESARPVCSIRYYTELLRFDHSRCKPRKKKRVEYYSFVRSRISLAFYMRSRIAYKMPNAKNTPV